VRACTAINEVQAGCEWWDVTGARNYASSATALTTHQWSPARPSLPARGAYEARNSVQRQALCAAPASVLLRCSGRSSRCAARAEARRSGRSWGQRQGISSTKRQRLQTRRPDALLAAGGRVARPAGARRFGFFTASMCATETELEPYLGKNELAPLRRACVLCCCQDMRPVFCVAKRPPYAAAARPGRSGYGPAKPPHFISHGPIPIGHRHRRATAFHILHIPYCI
jgi:hypothetical protein